MKVKTSELKDKPLDWGVAKCEGDEVSLIKGQLETRWTTNGWKPSTDWSQGGPIIEREFIHWGMTAVPHGATPTVYLAYQYQSGTAPMKGPTPLIAAMRCFCASRLGDEVEIPEELL
jgi:hypothetical protein